MENNIEEETGKLINSSQSESPKSLFDTYKGLLFMFFSCLLKSLFGILCKYALFRNQELTSYHLLFYKVCFMLILFSIFSITIYKKNKKALDTITQINKQQLIFLIIRSLLSILACSLTTFALKYMSISDVFAIFYLYPGVVVLLSNLILNEKVGKFDYICLLACFIGAVCVLRPGMDFFEGKNMFGILTIFVLLSVLFKASEDIILRYIGKKIHYLIIPFLYSGVGFFVYLLQIIVFNENKGLIIELSFFDWIIIFLIAFLSVSYQCLMALAFGNENAGRASMINYFQILFTFVADIVIFKRKAVFLDYLGILLIFGFNFTNGCIKIYFRSKDIVYKKTNEEVNNDNNV